MVHMGIVFMFIGYTGAAFNQDITKEAAPGSSFELGAYKLHRQHAGWRQQQLRLAEAAYRRLTRLAVSGHARTRAPIL